MFYHQLDSNPTGAGLQATSRKRQATSCKLCKVQAASVKQQASSRVGSKASSSKLLKVQATSVKPQAASIKLQATSGKLFNIFSFVKFRDARSERLYFTFENHIAELAKLRNEAREKKAWSAAVNAEVARGKAAGLYVEQKIIRTGKLEDLSSEQLESRLKQIISEYSPILEGVEVDELKDQVKKQSDRSTQGLPKTVQPILHENDQVSLKHDTYASSSSSEESSS
jgi:hypothetical protein